ncbi:hypothetical protein ATKI12_5564 [Kitasatospora sp. Ki12]
MVDTIGAGDAFSAALLASLAGRPASCPLEQCRALLEDAALVAAAVRRGLAYLTASAFPDRSPTKPTCRVPAAGRDARVRG